MKKRITTLMFSLLLAVGWTSSVFAQAYTFTEDEAKAWTYSWTDANGRTYDNVDPTLKVTDAYQMYYLLRHVYMDKHFPGPYYSAYKADGTTREREVYYGGMDSGWDIPGIAISAPTTTTTITEYVKVNSINELTSGGQYLIVYESGNRIMNGSLNNLDATSNYIGVTITNNTIPSNTTTDNASFTITAVGNYYTILSHSGYYMGRYQNSNGIHVSTTVGSDYYNTIQITNGTVSIKGTATRYLRYNTSDNRFRYYGTTSQNVAYPQLYKRVTRTITTGGDTGIGDIIISGTNGNAVIKSINVTSGGTTLFSWNYPNNYLNFSPGMVVAGYGEARYFGYGGTGRYIYYFNNNYGITFDEDSLDPIILQGWLFDGYNNVTVTIQAFSNSSTYGNLIINNETRNVTSTAYNNPGTYTWTLSAKSFAGPTVYQADQYKPTNEGYTALIVKLKNSGYLKADEPEFAQQCFYNSKDSIISYLTRNVESIQLLTDGLRIGENDKVGTVFNAPIDEYNKFFFLSKGQARQKSDIIVQEEVYREHLLGENVPFAQLFEQFSPTGGQAGDDIKDFYGQMMQGKVYRIVHDCLSVIQNEHEFSMSGNDGTTPYKMTGMNFFIPDHRLQYWELTDTVMEIVYTGNNSEPTTRVKDVYAVDGRDMNPYQPASGTKTNNHSTFYETPTALAVWYAQYDTAQHAPLVGIYLLTLEAEASQCDGYSEDNRYYNVDLDWTSSLNEMAGGAQIDQEYIIYQVVTDSITGERSNVPIDTVNDITHLRLDTLYEQHQHSYALTYVIQGSPTDSDHPGFIAWSNEATVIIPGYDDFLILNKHHIEADFDVNYSVPEGKNYYRNYLYPENDIVNGLTVNSIREGNDAFILYRTSNEDGKVPVAKIKLAVNNQGQVLYRITYFDENEDYNGPNNIDIDAIIQQLISNMNNN